MKLNKIKSIIGYKSYTDYSWQKYFNSEKLHDCLNIFYGENGCGKSSITNILKSVCNEKEFEQHQPKEVRLEFNDSHKDFEDTVWNETYQKGSILFFDREFVDRNIHLGHNRGTKVSEHEQESGKLIIEFDNEAIKLREKRDQIKNTRDEIQNKVSTYKTEHQEMLDFSLSDEENIIYNDLCKLDQEELPKLKITLVKEKAELDQFLTSDKINKGIIKEIHAIEKIEKVAKGISYSNLQSYKNVFEYQLEEKTKINAEQSLVSKIKSNKDFFSAGLHIRNQFQQKCPFCQSTNEEENIKIVIDTYNEIFDHSYEVELEKFKRLAKELVSEIDSIEWSINKLPSSEIFLKLKGIDESFGIDGIYKVEEEKCFKKPSLTKLLRLKKKIDALEKPDFESIEKEYTEAFTEVQSVKEYFDRFETLVTKKNKLIELYKIENTNEKLLARVTQNETKLEGIQNKIKFLDENKISKKSVYEIKINELKKLEKYLDQTKDAFLKSRKEYEEFTSSTAFSNLLTKIQSFFLKFNFNFILELEAENRRTGTTKEFPFAFKVMDIDNNERDFKDGLSEGELQVLSLCFFFAFLDIQNDKSNKILIFDDPITSLDNSNLSCLVELISDEYQKFSQTLIFTHHLTFFKFLQKKFKTSEAPSKSKGNEYTILRNKKEFGGSFILRSKKDKFIKKLKAFMDLTIDPEHPDRSIDIELEIIRHGQYLRYETERFIKNTLLHWNANDFPTAIEGVKRNKFISNKKLDKLKQVYSFCNWTTSHVDVGDDHGLTQLKQNIEKFLSAVET